MASAQLMKEEFQSNMGVPEGNASPGLGDNSSGGALERAVQLGVTNGDSAEEHYNENDDENDDEIREDYDGMENAESDSGSGSGSEQEEDNVGDEEDDDGYESESASDEDDENLDDPSLLKRRPRVKNEDDEEGDEDEDEEEEEEDDDDDDDELDSGEDDVNEDAEMDVDADIIEDAEGVGAVKIRPGETDDEDESEASGGETQSSDEDWDENVANVEEEEEEDEEEEGGDVDEEGATGACVLCKQDDEHGHDENSEASSLHCSLCLRTAHESCAQEHGFAVPDEEAWRCPDCVAEAEHGSVVEAAMDIDGDAAVNGFHTDMPICADAKLSPGPQSATASGDARPEDYAGSVPRSLRKRRSSPIEAEEGGMSLRKRRKNTAEDLNIEDSGRTTDGAMPSSARSLRVKSASSLVSIEKKTKTSLVLKMRVTGAELRKIFTKRRKYTRKNQNKTEKSPRPDSARSAVHVGMVAGAPPLITNSFIQPFYSFFDKETEELKGKPYGGILSEAEADTSRTFPVAEDRRKFGEAKQQAEEERQVRLLATQAEAEAPKKKPKKAIDPASQIECIEFGGWEIGTWYAAPYPEEYSRNQVLYICEFCLKYMNSDYVAWRHKLKCPAKHPPGDEIYRYGSVSVFEVDGRKNPVYCQNLCLLAKLFLGSKTLYYDVEPFLFYVLCEYDELGYHFVGYFSKEKRASSQNNVSCILTLPIHQRKGYGNLLIDFSYLLTRAEKKTGSPEKPLSDMGLVSYRNYWRLMMCRYLLATMAESKAADKLGLSIKRISDDTGMTADDVISALEGLRCLVRDPQTGLYAFRVDLPYCREYVAKWEAKKYVTLNPDALTWTPYVMGRGNATNFELGPALTAIAPRDEDEESKPADDFFARLVNGGDNLSEVKLANRDAEEAKPLDDMENEHAATVLESTELNEHEAGLAAGDDGRLQLENIDTPHAPMAGPNDDALQTVGCDASQAEDTTEGSKRTTDSRDLLDAEGYSVSKAGTMVSTDDWTAPYANVPATSFVVFPPISTRRFNYARTTIGRPPVPRVSSGVRGRSRHGTGSIRRSTVSRPKSTSTRKKTGGTGRGPGRWPKGTKKSDYGNADSGPGLPPAWIAERKARQTTLATTDLAAPSGTEPTAEGDAVAVATLAPSITETQEEEADEPMAEATVQVHTPPEKPKNGISALVLSSGKSRSSPRLGKGKGLLQESEDTVMVGGEEDK